MGFDVVSAATGAETLKALADAKSAGQPFDLVIADDQMPDCDGVSFAARVKSVPAIAPTALILLTSLDRHGNVNLTRAGFSAYLTKPVRGSELRACIERVFEREMEAAGGRHHNLVTRSSLATDQGQGQYQGRVLVVEDNVVNQQVAQTLPAAPRMRGGRGGERQARGRGIFSG